MTEPALTERYALIRYHRRGYLGSSPPGGPLSMAQQAADARGLLEHLEVEKAHVAGHSYGGAIALQLALDAPECVHSLLLLEPALLTTPAGEEVRALIAAASERYKRGEWEAAEDLFLGSPAERAALARSVPGSVEQALRDMDTYFSVEVAGLEAWSFGAAQAAAIGVPTLYVLAEQSPVLYREIRERIFEWMPQTETARVQGATHLYPMTHPAATAEAMREFLGRHPSEVLLEAEPPTAVEAPTRRQEPRRDLYNATDDLLDGNLEQGRVERTALRTAAGNWTYGQVAAGANRVGNALLELGVDAEDRVLLVLPDSPEFATAFFGAIKVGAVPVPVSTNLSPDEYAALLDDSRARIAVVGEPALDAVRGARDAAVVRHLVVVGEPETGELGFAELTAAAAAELSPADTTRDDVGFWLYGADSAGRPKGVVHLQHAMRASADAYGKSVLGLHEDDLTYSSSKLYMAYGLGNSLHLPFAAGAASILVSEPATPRVIAHVIRRFRPTLYFGTPVDFSAMLAARGFSERADDFASLRACVASGGPLPGAVLRRWLEGTGVEILEGMGSVESCHIFISNIPGDVRPGSAGVAVDGYEVRLVDDHGRDVATGEPGRLLVKGDSIFASYHRRRELTADALQGEWLRTGEMFSRDDSGRFFHHGRRDEMLALGGMLVSPREIEKVLGEDEHVVDCAIVGLPDAERLIKPEALVVAADGAELDLLEDALRQLARRRLGGHKTPRAFHFVPSLPRGDDGELRRDEVRLLAEHLA
jgi:benzoate-CoA ligase